MYGIGRTADWCISDTGGHIDNRRHLVKAWLGRLGVLICTYEAKNISCWQPPRRISASRPDRSTTDQGNVQVMTGMYYYKHSVRVRSSSFCDYGTKSVVLLET